MGLMILSTLGYAFVENDSQDTSLIQEYGDYKFYRYGESWQLNVQEQKFYFQYLPQETDNVSIIGIFNLADYSGKPLYLVNNNPASQEITNNLGNYVLRTQEACLTGAENSSVCNDLPKKDCTNNLFIFIADEAEGKVWKQDNCVYISGNLAKASDAFVYKVLGIK